MHTISMSIQCIHTNLAHTLHWIIIVYTYLKCMNFQSYSDGCALSIIIWVRCGARHMIYYHSTLLMFCDVINFQFPSAATTAAPPPATTPGHGHSELLVRWQPPCTLGFNEFIFGFTLDASDKNTMHPYTIDAFGLLV